MRWGAGLALACALAPSAHAWADGGRKALVIGCIESAAAVYRLPPAVIVILLSVEGGSLGRISQNSNGTADIGPMQVNSIWVPGVARHWQATTEDAYVALRDNFCANVEAGTWILRQAIDSAHGDFWSGVGFYHSHDPGFKADYLRKVLHQALRLQAEALRTEPHSPAAGS
jgi:soluble lytic murein transglycosylase-like protein